MDQRSGPKNWAIFSMMVPQDFFEFEGLGERARDLVEDAQMVHLPAFNDRELALLRQRHLR
jgi:hypothetical protein